jgi:hypothetical protein
MPRSAASIQAEIDILEARLSSAASLTRSAGSDGTNLTYEDRASLTKRLDSLYMHLGRANGTAPMFARSRVDGLH